MQKRKIGFFIGLYNQVNSNFHSPAIFCHTAAGIESIGSRGACQNQRLIIQCTLITPACDRIDLLL
jgi:hypothetical protein